MSDRNERIKELWRAGNSASVIAAEMGDVSRSGVMGVIHRAGLQRSGPVIVKARKPAMARPKPPADPLLAKLIASAPCTGRGLQLLDLTATTCHWPVGDTRSPDFYFCGAATAAAPYCVHHTKLGRRANEQR